MSKKYEIYGEDPNCDLQGSHVMPLLGYAEGEYENVLAYAKTLKGWFTWGSGGRLSEYVEKKFIKVDENTAEVIKQKQLEDKKKKEKLQKEKDELEKRLNTIKAQLTR